MNCAVACCDMPGLADATRVVRGASGNPARARRYAGRLLLVALLALAGYGEGWLLRDAPSSSPEYAGARCAAAAALESAQAGNACTLVSLGVTP